MYASIGTMCLHAYLSCTKQPCDDVLLYELWCYTAVLSNGADAAANCKDLHDDCMSNAHINLHRLHSGLHTAIPAWPHCNAPWPSQVGIQARTPTTHCRACTIQSPLAPRKTFSNQTFEAELASVKQVRLQKKLLTTTTLVCNNLTIGAHCCWSNIT